MVEQGLSAFVRQLDAQPGGGVLVVHARGCLGRAVRDVLDLIHDLAARGVRNVADLMGVDSSTLGGVVARPAGVLTPSTQGVVVGAG